MKLVAVAVALFGMFGAVSGVAEGLAGGRQGMLGSTYLLSVVLSVTAGGLLIAAGVTALRATPSGNRAASRAATASLVVFVLARIVFGWMSLFIQLMGILLPLAILVVLHRSPGRRSVV